MRLPDELRAGIDRALSAVPSAAISRAAAEFSDAYRKGQFVSAPLKSPAHRLAYLQVRMPATYAACRHVFEKTREQIPGFAPASLLDLGSGPGTAAWAALATLPDMQKITLVERDPELVTLGRSLVSDLAPQPIQSASWTVADLRTYAPAPHDIVILSYALGELSEPDARRLVRQAWNAAQLLVLIEPGTPKAFARLAELRKQLIADGAVFAAPCPHERQCPLFARADWCHFAERLERTAEHRRIKGGSLGYEDEKFSYLAATRLPVAPRAGRIVRHPMIRSGYVQLQVCAPDDLEQVTVTKSQKEFYRSARKARWGDRWPPS